MAGGITDMQMSVQKPCCTFSVQVRLTGFSGERCRLRWVAYYYNGGTDAYAGGEHPGKQGIEVIPEANDDQARFEASVPLNIAGQYRVRFFLYDPDNVELDRVDSSVFTVTVT
jgi:hypothetical protein